MATAGRWSRVVPAVMIAAGVGLSGWLLVRPATGTCGEAQAGPTAPGDVSVPEPADESDASCPDRWEACVARSGPCRAELEACQARREEVRPAGDRFLAGEPSPELEARAGRLVAPAFEGVEGLSWSLECRADVCRIDTYWSREANDGAQAAIQRIQAPGAVRDTFPSIGFRGQPATEDAVTGEILAATTIYLDASPPERP